MKIKTKAAIAKTGISARTLMRMALRNPAFMPQRLKRRQGNGVLLMWDIRKLNKMKEEQLSKKLRAPQTITIVLPFYIHSKVMRESTMTGKGKSCILRGRIIKALKDMGEV